MLESRAEAFFDRVEQQVALAIEDAGKEAGTRRGAPSDTRGEVTGRMRGRIGSSRPYAKAQERGAYIVPRRKKALRYASGRFSMRSRLTAKRYLAATARRWPQIVSARLRGV